ncbi:GerA spore germination protein [Tumebacillus sp. BK434]|uniref:spore germination protein n=1 Tax=Tumebacillus sp. BK434 TaxID=2512169 RepID=UPI00104D4A21|nr:spore germination protein [Tumebacillus sp. BK434]TCP54675.1 GerA spore germination protein [Tumebacillus sp. BK434]
MKKVLTSLLGKWLQGQGMNTQRGEQDVPDVPFGSDGQENIRRVMQALGNPPDLISESFRFQNLTFRILYVKTMINFDFLQRDLLGQLQKFSHTGQFAMGQKKSTAHLQEALALLLEGWTLVTLPGQDGFVCFKTQDVVGRNVGHAENQSIVIGPQEAFNESLELNLSLIRKRLRSEQLRIETHKIGTLTHTTVALLSVDGVVNEKNLQEMRERIKLVDTDALLDSGTLAQLINDQPLSPFPQFHMVERPDSVVSALIDGKVIVLVDGTPYVLMGPSAFIEFFHSPEDYFNRWASSSLVRLLRIFGVFVSITFSAIYVAVLTFHYEVIPANMLKTIAMSRARVPFPPLYEAMFLELTLEVLREAGARLPTKVGQTMGIVGGIVIGQAAVTAGLTSNVMIIIVSLSALASFVTPSYMMSNAVRVIRFPVILFAGWWGFVGMMVCLNLLLIHLLNLSSLGAPYMTPFAPLRLADLKDTLIRLPTQMLSSRPALTRARRGLKKEQGSMKRK